MKKFTNDHRTRVTRLLLRRALTELLRQKPLSAISIKELCETAGVNRGTFYSHYTDLHDLLEQMEEEMLADFRRALDPLLESAGEEALPPIRVTTEIFRCLRENADICTVTLGPYGDKAFAMRLINLGRERCLGSYTRLFADASPKQLEFYYAFASAGCIGLLQTWLAEGMLTPAEEMAQMAEDMMMYGVGFLRKE